MHTQRLSFGSLKSFVHILILGLLILCITSCARVQTAQSWTPCRHPLIDPSSQHGVYRALLSYQEEVDTCNAINGVLSE